jgi:hypothetical protein
LFVREKLCRLMSEVYEERMLPVKFWLREEVDSRLLMIESQIANVATLALGSRPRQWGCKGAGQEEARESHHLLPGMWESVREWTFTLPSELPCWELVRVGVPKGLLKLQRAF